MEWIAHRIPVAGQEMLTIQKEALHAAYPISGGEAMIKSTTIQNHIAHRTADTREFKGRTNKSGIGDAVDRRDAPFGGRTNRGSPLQKGPPREPAR